MPTVENEIAEMESVQRNHAELGKRQYLEAVQRSVEGEPLPAEAKLQILAAVGVTMQQFAEDVKRQKRRGECQTKVARTAEHQASLEDSRRAERDLLEKRSEEMKFIETRYAKLISVPRQTAENAKAALDEIAEAEKFLAESEGVSAIDPHPYRPIFADIVAADAGRGYIAIMSKQTSPMGSELHQQYGQLSGLAISPALIGRRIEVEWFQSNNGRQLRAVRFVEAEPAAVAEPDDSPEPAVV